MKFARIAIDYRLRLVGAVGLTLFAACGGAGRASAHFPWLAADEDGRVVLFFSESPAERTYRVPEAVKLARVEAIDSDEGSAAELALDLTETESFAGLRSATAREASGAVVSTVEYGNYNGLTLTYHAKGILERNPGAWGVCQRLKLDVTPRLSGERLTISATWDGRPAANCSATLALADGTTIEARTDERGVAEFAAPAPGLAGCIVERTGRRASGSSETAGAAPTVDYATCTFVVPDAARGSIAVPALPEGLASFGAAVCDGWLYVYGGHVGEEHAHSRENLSVAFRRTLLSAPGSQSWEELPRQTPLQGLPLAAHGGKLYRVGGLSMRNAPGEEEDLRSVAEFAAFDPQSMSWTPLPPLPEERSSHDAAVVGDELFVVGGWRLSGTSPGSWLSTAWKIDLAKPQLEWKPIAPPPAVRRALAAAAWNGKLVVLGGMTDDGKVSRRADLYDPTEDRWSTLPELPGAGMDGFGVAAWSVEDRLYASSADGVLYSLSTGATAWERAGELATPRFFHRLVPGEAGGLLAVAGASPDEGHLATTESVTPEGP